MHNLIFLMLVCSLMAAAVLTGYRREGTAQHRMTETDRIPFIGRLEVLNGCGISGAADAVADFLRRKKFDVKKTDNAETFNYPFTIVVSRSADVTVARAVAEALRTDKMVLVRNEDTLYDVTVILGSDFGERVQ
jgi:hypothetical protein